MTLRPNDLPIDRPVGARAFDFLLGRWRIHNRRLWRRLVASNDWEEFPSSLEVRPILGGLGNVDQFRTVLGETYFEGISLRLFSLADDAWSIYWADSSTGVLLPPLTGNFDGSKGVFYGNDVHRGQPVSVRFLWESFDDRHAKREQAYSIDEGRTWETNWVMNLERD